MVLDSNSEKIGFEKSIGFSTVKMLSRIQYQKHLVSEKVLDSVSFRFWVFWVKFWFQNFLVSNISDLVSEEKFGFGFVQILCIVTHCS